MTRQVIILAHYDLLYFFQLPLRWRQQSGGAEKLRPQRGVNYAGG